MANITNNLVKVCKVVWRDCYLSSSHLVGIFQSHVKCMESLFCFDSITYFVKLASKKSTDSPERVSSCFS